MKKIAIITGASSGMGRRFAETAAERFGGFDEIWAVARRLDRLEALKEQLPCPVRPIAADLSDPASFREMEALLKAEKPCVKLLINASGFGKFQAVADSRPEDNLNMVDVNCKAVMAMCQLCLPYLADGSRVINIASVAAFQPIPFINVYAATKAFVLSFSRALNRELAPRGIRVMALCPFWTKTEFFDRAVVGRDAVVKKYVVMYDPNDIVDRAWKDLARGKDVSVYGAVARGQKLLVKLLPHSLIMTIWMRQQKLP